MFKQLEITLYDFFGYLLPGAIIFGAMIIGYWAIFWPSLPIPTHFALSTAATVSLLFAFYLVGHLGQALGNLMEQLGLVKHLRNRNFSVPLEMRKLLLDEVSVRFGPETRLLSGEHLFALCDQTLVHHGSLGERDIFVYREGFYRGICVALCLLCMSTILRLIHTPVLLVFGSASFEVHRSQIASSAALMALGAWLAFERYLRFGRHKCQSCFLRFLALMTETRGDSE